MFSKAIAQFLLHKTALLLIGCSVVLFTGAFVVTSDHFFKIKNSSTDTVKPVSKDAGASGADTVSTDTSAQTSKTTSADSKKTVTGTSASAPTNTTTAKKSATSTSTGSTGTSTQTQTGSSGGSSQPSAPAAPAAPMYFSMAASGVCPRNGGCSSPTGLPRADSYCSANVTATTWEPRPDNYTANHTQGPADPTTIPWGANAISGYWFNSDANVRKVDGYYTGNTTQIIQWAACKWGIDEDLIRAVAVQESDWHQNTAGDVANGCAHSFSIIQVRDATNAACPINHNAWGGMPYTQNSTALALDFYGAIFRSCYDGDYYDGGPWLYGGQTVAQVAAAHDWDYVKWGCVGQWFSGNWYSAGAQNYINLVKNHLSSRAWTAY